MGERQIKVCIAWRGMGVSRKRDSFSEEALREAAKRNPQRLRFDEDSGDLWWEGPLSEVKGAEKLTFHNLAGVYDEVSMGCQALPSQEDLEIEEAVIEKIRRRRDLGREKYKKTMEREDLGSLQWAQHALEESLDHSVYLKKFMREHRRRLEGLKGLLEKAVDMILYYDAEYTNDDELPSIVPEIRAGIAEINEELDGKQK